jgi:hypothetical protein
VLPVSSLVLAAVASCAAVACAPAVAVRSGHTSSRDERATAARKDRELGVLERQKPEPGEATCRAEVEGVPTPICWTSELSTARVFDVKVDARYLAAAERRRTSQALRDVEATACDGISVADRVESPFAHREDILDVEEIRLPGREGAVVVGARVQFRGVPGLTAQELQRVVDCHIARDSVLGHDVPEMSYCPLVPVGARATVKSGTGSYFVEVVSDDDRGARDIAQRAMALWP